MKKYIIVSILFFLTTTQAQCWKTISAGYGFTLAIKTDGTLWGCGYNDNGELGDGTNIRRFEFVQIGTDTDWDQVSAGSFHSLGLKTDGSLWAWGSNDNGELGTGNYASSYEPIQVGEDYNWKFIKARSGGSSAIKTDTSLYNWGRNEFGQLGDLPSDNNSNIPVPISIFNVGWASVTGNGYDFVVGMKIDGSIWSWGYNAYGQLGLGMTSMYEDTPQQIGSGQVWKEITAGDYSCLALKADGTLWSWGRNEYAELGDGTTISRSAPVHIGTDIWKHIDSGNYNSKAIRQDSTLWAWGANFEGELGDGTTTYRLVPTQIGIASDYESVSSGGFHTLALRSDNSLQGNGWNAYGQLGLGTGVVNQLTPFTMQCPSLGLDAITADEQSFNVYPNPVHQTLYFHDDSSTVLEKVSVVDMTGKVVLQAKNMSEGIEVQSLQPGIYIVQATSSKKTYRQKFVKF